MLARQVGQRALSLNAQWARSSAAAFETGSQLPWALVEKEDEKTSQPSLPNQPTRAFSTLGSSRTRMFSPAKSTALQHFLTRPMSTSTNEVAKAPSSNVGLYLGGLAALHVLWTMGGVDWMVSLNTSFVQSAVWITALSFISPAALWTSLKRHEHVEDEKRVRGAQLSSGVKIV